MNRDIRILALAGALLSTQVLAHDAVADVIDFESVINPTGNPLFSQLDIGAYRFTCVHMHVIGTYNVASNVAQNTSKAVLFNEGGSVGGPITLQRVDGQPFALTSIYAAEGWTPPLAGYPNSTVLRLDAKFATGQASSQSFMLDGALDGAGGVPDYQTITPQGLSNLLSVTFTGLDVTGAAGGAFELDDVVVSTEPCVAAYGSGCPGAGGFVPVLDAPLCATSGLAFVITLQNAPGGAQALLLFGQQQAHQPIGLSGCSLLVQPLQPLLVAIPLGGVGPGNGFASLGGNIPPGLGGLKFKMQALVSDPTTDLGFVTTNGLAIVVQ